MGMMDEWNPPAEQVEYFSKGEILHEVKLPYNASYKGCDDYAADAATWIDDPESGSSGRYTVRKRPDGEGYVMYFYFDDAQTAFNFKLRWA